MAGEWQAAVRVYPELQRLAWIGFILVKIRDAARRFGLVR